jgi:uncharacterized protein YabE (DUF348 family)
VLRSMKYGLNGAVIAGLIAAPVVWNSVDKSVHLVVDGHATTVSTTASDVAQVLHSHGYQVTSHDLVAPSMKSGLHDGMSVVLRHGRLLHLDIDGRRANVWTTADTVQDALGQLGYTTSDFVSVSRSQRLPLAATDIAIRTPRTVTVIHDGHTDRVTTTDATVGQVLTDLDLTVGPKDRLSVPVTSPVTPDETVQLRRVGERTVVRTKSLAYRTRHKADPTLTNGTTELARPGKKGVEKITYSVVFVDGKEVARTVLSTVVLQQPQDKIISYGTKAPKQLDQRSNSLTLGPTTPAQAQAIAKVLLAARGWGGADQYSCLFQMWTRESGWNVSAENSIGAYGIPQSLPGDKMASVGADWQTDATTQIKWGLTYIAQRYGTPCDAWSFWQAHDYY